MWRLESEPCTKTIGPVTVSAACDEECVSYMTGPAHYGSREAPVVSRLATPLAARRSLEGDLKVVLSFPGFGGERAWNGFGQAMWLGRVLLSRASWPIRSSLDSSLRLRLSSTRRLSPTRRQHSGKERRSRLPPKLESTARPARLRRRGPVVPGRGGGLSKASGIVPVGLVWHAMWLCAVRGACCYHARAGLFVRPWTPACGSGSRPRGDSIPEGAAFSPPSEAGVHG